MIRLTLHYLLVIVLVSSCAVSAGTRKKSKAAAQTPRLMEASSQRTLPGMRDASPSTTYRVLIVWNSNTPPETFFWRPEGDQWMTCAVSRVHKNSRSLSPENAAGLWYQPETIRLQDIHKGDTLELIPLPGGRDQMPAAAKSKAVKSIYYYTAKGGWQTLPVTAFRKLPDLIMP